VLFPIAHGDNVLVSLRKSALLLALRIDLDVHRDSIQSVVSEAQYLILDAQNVGWRRPDIAGALGHGILLPRGQSLWGLDCRGVNGVLKRARGVVAIHALGSLSTGWRKFSREINAARAMSEEYFLAAD
jgi:hypothetical protein